MNKPEKEKEGCSDSPESMDAAAAYNLLDNACGNILTTIKEVDSQKAIVTDMENALDERLNAYEDIIDSEIGDTSMVRARNIERDVGFRQLYLKFEGGNPTGTQKDRIALAQSLDALRRGFDEISVTTCGNYGVAIAMAASFAGIRCSVFIPEGYKTKRIDEMIRLGAKVRRVKGDYETAVEFSANYSKVNGVYDANPGGENISLQLTAYGEIAREIYDELRDAPSVVAVPVSNGTTLAGIYKGLLSLYRRGKTSKMPKIVAGFSFRKNPIVQSFLKNSMSCEDLQPTQIHETRINEPLVNWHSIDGDLALSAIRATCGWASNASDKKMRSFARFIVEKEGLKVLPASCAGLIALIERHQKDPLPSDRYVVVLTGRNA